MSDYAEAKRLDVVKARILRAVERRRRGGRLTYRLTDEPFKSITCLVCGATSYNLNDVQHLYCPRCQTFHGDLWARELQLVAHLCSKPKTQTKTQSA